MADETKLQLVIDNNELNELKGIIEATKLFAQTLSNYSIQNKMLNISNTLTEITKNINSSYLLDMCSKIAKNYSNQFKTITDTLSNIKLDRMIAIQNIMQRTIEVIKENCDFNFYIEYKSNLFKELSQATGYIVRDERENAIELVEKTLPARINEKGLEIIDLFQKIQELDFELVKLTPPSCGAIATISSRIATNDTEFGVVCNSVYQLFYEGFGSDKHRSTKYIPFDTYNALITIKHLRLRYCHDIYHGDAKNIEKKNENIMNAFVRLINKKMPVEAKDYRMCQLRLYELIIDWLKQLINIIIKQPISNDSIGD